MIFLSFWDFAFMKDYFLFLKTTAGKGYFNIFLSTTFLIGGGGSPIIGEVCCVLFLLIGIFFVVCGHCLLSVYDNKDFNSREVAGNAARGATNMAYENRHLLDDSH